MQTNSYRSGIKSLFQIIRSNEQIASSLLQHMPNTNYYWRAYTNMNTHRFQQKGENIERKRATTVENHLIVEYHDV